MNTVTKPNLLTILFILFLVNTLSFSQTNYLNNIGVSDSIYSKTLSENREFWVQVPKSFNPDNPLKYPVAYVLDGEFI